MTYGDFNGLTRRTAADKALHDQAFNIAKNLKYDGLQRELASIVYNFFDKKPSSGALKKYIIQNEELVAELHNPIIRRFEKRKLHSSFILLYAMVGKLILLICN